jgi:hypothetical protein
LCQKCRGMTIHIDEHKAPIWPRARTIVR